MTKKMKLYFDQKKKNLYYEDNMGQFHEVLETTHNSSENIENNNLAKLKTFQVPIISKNIKTGKCNNREYFYTQPIFESNDHLENNYIKVNKGLYFFNIYLNITSNISQYIYIFLREKKIIPNSLKVIKISNLIPNNVNYNFYIDNKNNKKYQVGIISEDAIKNCNIFLNLVEI